MNRFDVTIIGAGAVGSAIARELSRYNLEIALVDKENDVAEGISKANSGVIHAGFNVKPGSLKARLNRAGLDLLPKTADELGVKYKFCKKLVVAKDDYEKEHLCKLYENGLKNSSPGLSIIGASDIKSLMPGITGKYALYSERTGIITPYLFTIALAENAFHNGVKVFLSTQVTGIRKESTGTYTIFSDGNPLFSSRWVINSAGIFSDKIAGMVEDCPLTIHPCRGEYYILDKEAGRLLDMAVYPVPNKDGSGLGVHLTPTLNGNIMIGPSADYIGSRTDVSNTKPVMDQLKMEAYELMPALKNTLFIKNFSGIRPKLFNPGNNVNFEDFHIAESERNPRFINLIGIESPGLTSAPAIAKHVTENIIGTREKLTVNAKFDPSWNGCRRVADMDIAEIEKLVLDNPDFGQVVCRCEYVTKGEIIKALNNPFHATSLSAVRKRTHSMSGRCQGGFCISRIIKMLIDEFKIKKNEIIKTSSKSNMLMSDS